MAATVEIVISDPDAPSSGGHGPNGEFWPAPPAPPTPRRPGEPASRVGEPPPPTGGDGPDIPQNILNKREIEALARKESRAAKEKLLQEDQQERDEKYAARREALDAAKDKRDEERAAKEKIRQQDRQERDEKYAAKQEQQAAAKAKKDEEREAKEWERFQKQNDREQARNEALIKKREQQEAKESAASSRAVASAVGGAAASIIRGGGIGATVGGAAGGALGSRFGPAGAMIGSAVGEKAGGVVDNAIPSAAGFATKVAKNDGAGIASDAVEGAANAASIALLAIPGAGIPAALAMKTFGSTVGAANEVLSAFAARGRELSGYSGVIAGAAARQDVTRLRADISEARQFEQGYAKIIDKVTEVEEIFKAILNPIKDVIIRNLPDFINFMLSALTEMIKIGYAIPGVSDDKVKKVVDDIEKIRKRFEAVAPGGVDLLGPLLAGVDGLVAPFPVPMLAPVAPPPLIAVP